MIMFQDIVDHIIILIPDQGSEFCGAAWEQWLKNNHIEHRRNNPKSNGWTERANGTI